MIMVQGSSNSTAAVQHAQILENGMFRCEDCDFETNSLRKLGRHRSVNHSGTKYRCTECDFVTGYQSNFYRHRKQIHSNASSARMTVIPSSRNSHAPTPQTNGGISPMTPSPHPSPLQPPAYPPSLASRQGDPFGLGLLGGAGFDPTALMNSLATANGLGQIPATAGLLPSAFQQQLNAFMFAQAAAAAYLAAGGQSTGMPASGNVAAAAAAAAAAALHNPQASKSPEELVNDVLNDLSPMPSVIRTAPGPNSSPATANEAFAGSPAMPSAGSVKHCPVRTYACPHSACGHETRETRDHLHHLRDAHGERLTIYYCDHCSYASKTVAKVRRHASLIHKVDNHPVISSAPPELTDSAVSTPEMGSDSPLEQLRCGECKYTTTDPARFKKHQRCHQVYGPTTCSMCDFTTVYAWNLDRHVKSHNIPGRFSCFRCSFSQNTRQSMSFHLQHHHIIKKEDAGTQTEPIEGGDIDPAQQMPSTAIGHEVFLFERHAVHVNEGFDPNAFSEQDASSPAIASDRGTPCLTESSAPVVRKTPNATITVMPVGASSREAKTPTKLMPEAEIIESPAEPTDLREYESADPDIRKRTCSICGYQGKWISEMVRHKRVHTNERPFKCKYCSRTSKWKADLIRHVAKAHGIKVVSRYSRGAGNEQFLRMSSGKTNHPAPVDESLAIDVSDSSFGTQNSSFGMPENLSGNAPDVTDEQRKLISMLSVGEQTSHSIPGPTLNEAQLLEYFRLNGASPHTVPTSTSSSDHASNSSPSPPSSEIPDSSGLNYGCTACEFHSLSISEVYKHIRLSGSGHEGAEVRKPTMTSNPSTGVLKRSRQDWSCAKCGFSNGSRTEVIEHLSNVHSAPAFVCPECSFSSLYRKACVLHASTVHGVETVVENLIEPTVSEPDRSVPPKKRKFENVLESIEKFDEMSCNLCPFKSQNLEDLNQHIQGHEIPKAPLAYKCVFCPWYARRKQQIQVHMLLHTERPEDFMAAVERNLITPMSHPEPQRDGVLEEKPVSNDEPWDLSSKKRDSPQNQVLTSPLSSLRESGILGLADLSDVFKEFEALLPNAGLTSPQKNGPITIRHTGDFLDNSASVSVSPWNASGDNANESEPEDLTPRTAEIQKVKILVDGKESKVWQCRYCLHTSKRRANVRLHERKHFKRALKGTGFTTCPQCDFQGQRDEVLDHMIEDHSDNGHLFGRTGGGGGAARSRKIPKTMVSAPQTTHGASGMRDTVSQAAPKPKNHICTGCPAKFTDKAQLSRHEKFHGTDLRYKCHMCNYSVPFPINLTKHYKSHHSVGIIVTGNGTRQNAEENPEMEISAQSHGVEDTEVKAEVFDGEDTYETHQGDENQSEISSISVANGEASPNLASGRLLSPVSDISEVHNESHDNQDAGKDALGEELRDSDEEEEPSALVIDA